MLSMTEMTKYKNEHGCVYGCLWTFHPHTPWSIWSHWFVGIFDILDICLWFIFLMFMPHANDGYMNHLILVNVADTNVDFMPRNAIFSPWHQSLCFGPKYPKCIHGCQSCINTHVATWVVTGLGYVPRSQMVTRWQKSKTCYTCWWIGI